MLTGLRDYLDIILNRPAMNNQVVVYRGHADQSYKLTPSIYREPSHVEQEHVLLRELMAVHPDEFNSDKSTLELLVRAQHFGLPTRLLDVTFNPLVALFFATRSLSNTMEANCNGSVVRFCINRSDLAYFDSDTAACLTNLAKLRWELKQKINTNLVKKKFNKEKPIRRLIHFIRQEKSQFKAEIMPNDLDKILLVKPKQSNRRIQAQDGAFFLFGRPRTIDEQTIPRIEVDEIQIPSSIKTAVQSDLNTININEKTMFPEIDKTARYFSSALSTASARTYYSAFKTSR